MVITKPRKHRADIATVIIIVLAAIAITLVWCRYVLSKAQADDLEVIKPTTPVVTEKISAPKVEPVIVTKTPTVESEVETETPEVETVIESEIEYISLGEYKITAYCACKKCCGIWADSRPLDGNGNPIVYGASGMVLIPDYSIAVDPDVIPYGTKVYIDGREYIAHDTGGAIDGNRIDFYMGSHEDALEWGVQSREIFIIKD